MEPSVAINILEFHHSCSRIILIVSLEPKISHSNLRYILVEMVLAPPSFGIFIEPFMTMTLKQANYTKKILENTIGKILNIHLVKFEKYLLLLSNKI